METHFATIWESIADAVGDHDAIVQGDRRVSWRDYDDRAARLSQAFLDAGLTVGSKVGMFMYNCPEYAETQFAALKMRAVPVNVNYRYLDDELHYLLDNADAEAVVFHASLGERIARVRDRLPKLKLLVQVLDDEPLGGSTTTRRWSPRTGRRRASPAHPTTSTCSTPAGPPACRRA